jgi:hypothetical protein
LTALRVNIRNDIPSKIRGCRNLKGHQRLHQNQAGFLAGFLKSLGSRDDIGNLIGVRLAVTDFFHDGFDSNERITRQGAARG